ncbi:MAG TPA: delta-60 repeat domain-containing protein, partial [Thermomicrobiales bacterium]|nr:delta-60 repeat domain-containing protein [Thermomicrobiales bacterium]
MFAIGVGDLDPTFNSGGTQFLPLNHGDNNDDQANAVAIQSDGKILLAGSSQIAAGDFDFAVTRLNADGTLDTTFGTGGTALVPFNLGPAGSRDDRAKGVAILPDGSIVVGGYAQVDAAGNYDFALARLTPAGILDTTFGTANSGKVTTAFDIGNDKRDEANAIVVDTANQRILLAGFADVAAGDADFAVAGYTFDGVLDTSFGSGGGTATFAFDLGAFGFDIDDAQAIALDPTNGNIVLAGMAQLSATNYDMAIARLLPDGSTVDTTFDGDGRQTVAFDVGGTDADAANAVVVLPDGRIAVAGTAAQLDIVDSDYAFAELTAAGALDPTFDVDGKTTVAFNQGVGGERLDSAVGLVVQADGKLVATGSAQFGAANYEIGTVRLLADGTLDTSFGPAATGKVITMFHR